MLRKTKANSHDCWLKTNKLRGKLKNDFLQKHRTLICFALRPRTRNSGSSVITEVASGYCHGSRCWPSSSLRFSFLSRFCGRGCMLFFFPPGSIHTCGRDNATASVRKKKFRVGQKIVFREVQFQLILLGS